MVATDWVGEAGGRPQRRTRDQRRAWRDYHRAVRWLERSGGADWVSPQAWQLLVERLAYRRRLTHRVALALFASWIGIGVGLSAAGCSPQLAFVSGMAVGVVVDVIATLAFIRADVAWTRPRLDALGFRVTRPETTSVREILGRRKFGLVICALVCEVAAVAGACVSLSEREALLLVATLIVAGACTGGLGRAVLARPTLAGDPWSLAMDERLRTQDLTYALWPIAVAAWTIWATGLHTINDGSFTFLYVLGYAGYMLMLGIMSPRSYRQRTVWRGAGLWR